MIFTALDFLKKKKEKKKNDNNLDSKDNKIKKTKKFSKSKKNTKTKTKEPSNKEKKEKSLFPFSKNKEKKQLKKEVKKAKERIKLENSSLAYLLLTQFITIYFIVNCITFFFTKGTPIEGTFEYKNNTVYFTSIYEKVNYIEDTSLENFEVGDDIYLVKGKYTLKLTNKRKIFGFCIPGEVTKKDDYYIYITFKYEKQISGNVDYFSKNYSSNTNDKIYTVYMKKFLFEYHIDEDILKQVLQTGEDSIEDFKQDFKEGFNLKDLIGGK